jgi:predicted transposase YbfD/YdcC
LSKKTFEVARATGNHLIVQVKGNQPTLLKQVKALAREAPALSTHRQVTHARQRMEQREVRVFAAAALPAEWDGLIHTVPFVRTNREVRRTRDVFHTKSGEWRETQETGYYVSDREPTVSAQSYAQAVRGHGSIENRQHYVRDVTLGEDRSRIRHNPGLFARLRSFALNLLRSSGVTNIAEALYDNALNLDRILSYVEAI